MPIEIFMPALSPTMKEGKLAKWHVKDGDPIKAGEVIAEIETDKATMEVEAVDEGKISQLLLPEGAENVKVNTPIAVIDGEAEAAAPPAVARQEAARAPAPVRAAETKAGPQQTYPDPRRSMTRQFLKARKWWR